MIYTAPLRLSFKLRYFTTLTSLFSNFFFFFFTTHHSIITAAHAHNRVRSSSSTNFAYTHSNAHTIGVPSTQRKDEHSDQQDATHHGTPKTRDDTAQMSKTAVILSHAIPNISKHPHYITDVAQSLIRFYSEFMRRGDSAIRVKLAFIFMYIRGFR